ncbi:MAG: urea transport system permease protein [Candidatus Omnitrophota bacterium]|jgi:urea transport system permease protein
MKTTWTIFIFLSLAIGMMLPALAIEDDALFALVQKLTEDEAGVRAKAIDDLVLTGDSRLEAFFEHYRSGSLYLLEGRPVLGGEVRMDDELDEFIALLDVFSGEPLLDAEGKPLESAMEDVIALDVGRAERILARAAKFRVGLASIDPDIRLASVKRLGDPPRVIEATEDLLVLHEKDPVKKIRYTALESVSLIRMTDPALPDDEREAAARQLGDLDSARALAVLEEMIKNNEIPADRLPAYEQVVHQIKKYQGWVGLFDTVKRGLSSGSILILMALGLAVTFGMMGVINMAHGEMMMIGAYTTFCLQVVFGHTSSEAHNLFFIFALPISFLVAAAVGGLIEYGVVRHLYKRPLESLLATFGISLVLIQVIRLIFGDNQASNSPTWLVGNVEVLQDMALPYARVFIFCLTVVAVLGIAGLMKFTPLGLQMRATMQDRSMARAMGINTRMIDLFTFMLGSGIAGVAGCALTTIGGITPDMGQNYIIDSFLVVVAGGVGKLIGVICSGLGLGVISQTLEGYWLSPVWSKIVILMLLIMFIQFRPAGLFPPKGRLADD